MRWRVWAAVAAVVVLAVRAGAATRVVSAPATNPNGGEPFRIMTGIPKALTRDGKTTVGDGALAQNTI